MWYIKLDGTLIPIPYVTFQEAVAAEEEYKKKIVAPMIEILKIS